MSLEGFKNPLIVEVMPSGKRFRLHRPFTFVWKQRRIEVHVQAGFVTDFASIPRFLRTLIPKLGRYNRAAVIHDALYMNVVHAVPKHKFTRKEADECFRDAMEDLGVARWKINLMYWSVRIGGWLVWNKQH